MHWIKDVVFNEDKSCITTQNTAENFSLMRSFAINLIRYAGFDSITQGIRLMMRNIKFMWNLLGGED